MPLSRTCIVVLASVAACGGSADESYFASGIKVEVQPESALLQPGGLLQLAATVSGSAVARVNWSVDCGSITQDGLYTAPAGEAVCQVVARSEADTTKSGAATVTVTPHVSPPPAPPMAGWGATCAAEPFPTSGTRYYFCDCAAGADPNCVPGNDTNAGTTPGAPKRTWAAAIGAFNSLPAGGTVALCKGGRWTASADQTINNAACAPDVACPLATRTSLGCTPSTTCNLRDYQAAWGGTSKPVVYGNDATLSTGGGSVSAADGFRILNIKFLGTGVGVGFGPSILASDYEVCNVEWDNFGMAVYMELPDTSACQTVLNNGGSKRHYWRGNRIVNMTSTGILVEESDSEWDGNYIEWAPPGACSDRNHPVYHANNYCRSTNWTFKNNEVRSPKCSISTTVYVSKASENFVFENNLIDQSGSTNAGSFAMGITLGTWSSGCGGVSGACGHINTTIRGNRILMHVGYGIAADNAPGALVENNVIIYTPGNTSPDGAAAILVPHAYSEAAQNSSNVMVRNNTVYLAGVSGSLVGFDNSRASGTSARVYNNSFVKASGTANLTCLAGNATQIPAYGANHCYGYSSLGYGAGWITGAPSFVAPGANPATADFTPRATSPLRNTGSTASTCTVRGQTNRPCYAPTAITASPWSSTATSLNRDASPDIGAHEL
jgi:hypothetical protein